ncbi:hypothetical protein PBY51_021577 [Eleginops maclovinus]|uniref:Uncharacterized protein n=1 Tax=Eleginops maclovinus TaxID=56733 RepID=A0AAN7XG54_ELEMC|nr:hypothetical protein PBY51_021577 [Eleginops maclovinus]
MYHRGGFVLRESTLSQQVLFSGRGCCSQLLITDYFCIDPQHEFVLLALCLPLSLYQLYHPGVQCIEVAAKMLAK